MGGRSARCKARLGDVFGQVGHALQLVIDFHGRGDPAQIHGHRLVQGQDLQALLLDVVLLLVDLAIAGDDLVGQLDIAILQGADGLVNRLFHGRGQGQQVALQAIQVALKVFGHWFGSPAYCVRGSPASNLDSPAELS